MTGIIFTFPSGNIQAEYITTSLTFTENYYNKLKAVDNTVKLSVQFNLQLANALKLYGDNDIPCKVYDTEENCIFTGYVRKSFSFSKTSLNSPISLEIISPSYFLDKEVQTEIFKTDTTVATIINLLGAQAGLNLTCSISSIVPYFRAEVGDNIKNTVQQLLFEYGYTFDFDKDGAFVIYPLFNTPEEDLFTFDASNIQTKLQIDRSEKEYSGVTAKWDEKEFVRNQILYEDTEGGGVSGSCKIEIEPASYMYGSDNLQGKHYLNYDCSKGEVLYCSSIHPEVTGENLSNLQTSYENKITSVLWSAFNNSFNLKATYTKFQFWGDAWVKKATNESKTTTNNNEKSLEITLKYLNDKDAVSLLIEKIANYYRKSQFKVTFNSNEDIEIGSFVQITEESAGTITGRIIQKQKNSKKSIYYVVESVSEYIPAEVTETISNIRKPASDGRSGAFEDFNTIAKSLQEQIDGIEYNGTTCALDVASVSLAVDDQGFTQSVQTFTTQVILQRSENRLEWQLGDLQLPSGFSVVRDGNYLTFTVGEGISITAGLIKIPVLYKPVLSSDYYVDENGNYYVDENGNRYADVIFGTTGTQWDLYLNYIGTGFGKRLGIFTTITQITTSNPNVSDYFVWGGENRTPSSLAYEGFFRQGAVYKYIGTGKTWAWQADDNALHMQASMSDVLSLANADLKNNNSLAWEYMDHLTSNSAYIGFLVANEAFINLLAAKIVTAELVTTDALATTLQGYETVLALNEKLKDYKTEEELTAILTNYVQNNKLFNLNSSTIKDGVLDLDSIRNIAVRSGQTLIIEGYINTNLIETEVLLADYAKISEIEAAYAKISYLEGGNANFKGFFRASKGFLFGNYLRNISSIQDIFNSIQNHLGAFSPSDNLSYSCNGYITFDQPLRESHTYHITSFVYYVTAGGGVTNYYLSMYGESYYINTLTGEESTSASILILQKSTYNGQLTYSAIAKETFHPTSQHDYDSNWRLNNYSYLFY